MGTVIRIAGGGVAAMCAGVLCLPLMLGSGGSGNGPAWEDSCTPSSPAMQVASKKQEIPAAEAGGQVTVPLNPQGKQQSANWTGEQKRNASVITNVARSRGLPPRAAVIGVATAIQESMLKNIRHGDRDSQGLFQQRPSQGWGTVAQITDPIHASNSFLARLAKVGKWQTKPLTQAAQNVQRSGFPDAYAQWEKAAGELVVKSWGKKAVLSTTSGCDAVKNAANSTDTKGKGGWALPVENSRVTTPYKAGGGMWSSGSHTGIDFPVATGTRVQAVGTGTVVEAGWGGAYGNNVVIKMSDGKYTHYGHLSKISVSKNQTVKARQQIGLSGATGNVSGPHLHFEARTGPAYGSDMNPVAYLRSHGLSL
ncbi:M23 family metallopeptidase [Streptomyces botrytidirepellens]|uniref:M23 family metallopeptidase n=1 Tax=Streptomyces botrytidirepellens TaxID=2486417 RepID=A0A3M8WR67_9ACTN|nr:M23 family metallopeptidase [Streptomyces botrytidirepellens]